MTNKERIQFLEWRFSEANKILDRQLGIIERLHDRLSEVEKHNELMWSLYITQIEEE